MYKEIEIQAKIENSNDIRKLVTAEAVLVSENRQIDQYYVPAHRDFLSVKPIEEWFRIRGEKGIFSVNYKKWHYENEVGIYADEFETIIENKEAYEKILDALNFTKVVTVDKIRLKYNYRDYEIAFDTVVGLGDFIEIEWKGKQDVSPEEITDAMFAFLKGNNCGKIQNTNGGYPMALLFPEDVKYIDIL